MISTCAHPKPMTIRHMELKDFGFDNWFEDHSGEFRQEVCNCVSGIAGRRNIFKLNHKAYG
jgi:hypothetical protein